MSLWISAGRAAALAGLIATPAAGQTAADEIIRKALSAAPPQMADAATVVGPDGAVLKEGSGVFTCMITPEVPTGSAPMCADRAWMPWIEAWLTHKSYRPGPRIGIAYMLAGDTPETGGASNTDPYARAPTADNDWVVEGPHLMIIVPDEAMLEAIPSDPDAGGPYVMWRDTPFAHVMIPVAERPSQRTIAAN